MQTKSRPSYSQLLVRFYLFIFLMNRLRHRFFKLFFDGILLAHVGRSPIAIIFYYSYYSLTVVLRVFRFCACLTISWVLKPQYLFFSHFRFGLLVWLVYGTVSIYVILSSSFH